MPRSKNPNPRQVTEDGEKTDTCTDAALEKTNEDEASVPVTEDDGYVSELKIDLGEKSPQSEEGRESPYDETVVAKRDSLAKLAARKFAAVYSAGDDLESQDRSLFKEIEDTMNGDTIGDDSSPNYEQEAESPEARTSLNFSPSSPPSFFVMGHMTRGSRAPPLKRVAESNDIVDQEFNSNQKNSKTKQKVNSPSGMLNPQVMRWMKSRFEMKSGGKISASDVIQIYSRDMKDLPNPPPTLQNYQVGQLLRRIFPSIQRCKITVNSKRVWVYRHLSLIDPPLSNLGDEEDDDAIVGSICKENGIDDEELRIDERTSDSPMSVCLEPDGVEVEEGDSRPCSIGDEEEDSARAEKKKSNAILLGLLGQRSNSNSVSPSNIIESGDHREDNSSPNSCTEKNETESLPIMRKKRDSEVVDWLLDNYKSKAGYFVKSMDLLRRYNDGREELVKYLSQVGRVMKHVFPGVRHLRKSFRGGKREWVYLNLKPIEVDSDGEEAKNMQMPNLRRTSRPAKLENGIQSSTKPENETPDWKHERVNISHMPLSLSQNRNAIFKPRSSMYHSVSRIDGNKLIISRNSSVSDNDASGSKVHIFQGNMPQLQDTEEKLKTRIILYNKQRDVEKTPISDDCRAPSDLERDLFAPFTKISPVSLSTNAKISSSKKPSFFKIISGKDGISLTQKQGEWTPTSGVFQRLSVNMAGNESTSPDQKRVSVGNQVGGDSRWASKRLRLCATETTVSSGDKADGESDDTSPPDVGLDLSIKQELVSENEVLDADTSPDSEPYESESIGNQVQKSEILNLTKEKSLPATSEENLDSSINPESSTTLQTIHYKPNQSKTPFAVDTGKTAITSVTILPKKPSYNLKRKFSEITRVPQDTAVSWESLQNFNALRYGWLRSPHTSWTTSKTGDSGGRKVLRFVEWFLFSGQWLVNKQRALREVKIYDDWTVVIHALGRRVYPNDLGGITDLEKTTESLNKVFRVLAESKLCMGFPAPCVSDLHIHGILVSKFEVWSSREDTGEDIRQRAVNCQILYSGAGTCCSKCARIMRLHQQQRRGSAFIKRTLPESNQTRTFP